MSQYIVDASIVVQLLITDTHTAETKVLPRALEIGLKHQLAVYDSVYIALAEQLGYSLITDDGKQAAAATAEGITLKPITDFTP